MINLLFRDQNAGVRIGISVFLAFLWWPTGLYLFYLPYSIIMKKDGSTTIFYVLNLIMIVWYFIWSIANFADANGFVRIG
jgi:hypothetical protein